MALLHLLRTADVIHLAGPCLLPMLLGLLFRKPVVVEHHGYQTVCPNGLLLYQPTKAVCPNHFMEMRYNKCLRCNATNRGYVRSLVTLLLSFPRHQACKMVRINMPISRHVNNRLGLPRSRVIYYGICDPLNGMKSFDNEGCRVALPITFAYVGRLVEEKGLLVLLGATSQLKSAGYQFRLKFIGEGPQGALLEEMVGRLGLGDFVTFTGSLQGDILRNELADVAAVVMPSIWEETAGLAAIEQMMRGRLVIASDIGGLGEVVDGVGLKFAAGDTVELTSCLRRVLDDPSLVEVFGKKARQRALRFFLRQRMITEHLALYREVLGDSSS
jgi:glycosyltransferase involved in cell wall biosynthesis